MRRGLKYLLILGSLFKTPCLALPDFKVGSVLIDEEINSALTDWLEQLFKVAGLREYKPRVYLVVDPELNAAASTGGQILVHTGLIENCSTAAELLGVFAHEVGHIAGGHLTKIDQGAQEAILPAAAALLLGGVATLATGNSSPLLAGLMGGMHIFNRGMLKFTRTQESLADQAALSYLDRLHWGAQGLLDFFKVIDKKYQIGMRGLDPYSITHPLTTDRIKSVEQHLTSRSGAIPPSIETRFQRIRAKVIGFFSPSQEITAGSNKFFKSLSQENQTYTLSIALYRQGKMGESIERLNTLIKASPDNPYFYELKGQVQFDSGQHNEAIQSLEKAVQKLPKAKYIKILLAHVLLESHLTDAPTQAKKLLIPLTQQECDNTFAWRLLAIAHGKLKEEGQAALALAEEAALKGDKKMVKTFATRAKNLIKPGNPGRLRADDLLSKLG